MNPKRTNIIIAILFILMLASIAISAAIYQTKLSELPKGSDSPVPQAALPTEKTFSSPTPSATPQEQTDLKEASSSASPDSTEVQ